MFAFGKKCLSPRQWITGNYSHFASDSLKLWECWTVGSLKIYDYCGINDKSLAAIKL